MRTACSFCWLLLQSLAPATEGEGDICDASCVIPGDWATGALLGLWIPITWALAHLAREVAR